MPIPAGHRRLDVCSLTLGAALSMLMPLASAADRALAGPTVAELVAVCERGRAMGDVGVDAAMCEWYAVPCDCTGKAPDTGPRWCMPDTESVEAALPKVLVALRAEPRQQARAADVVPGIMARLYPCHEPGAEPARP